MLFRSEDWVVGAMQVRSDSGEVVLITDDGQLLRFDITAVRASGRPAGGVAGIRLAEDALVIYGTVVADPAHAVVATVAGDYGALPGTAAHSIKVTPLADFPGKGRATGGVRCHRLLAGENALITAAAGHAPIHACGNSGAAVEVPGTLGKRDGSGIALKIGRAHV